MSESGGVPDGVRDRVAADPYCDRLGIELVDLGPGRATTELETTADHLNFHSVVHGGAVNSLADAAFAAASNSRGETALALESNVSYLEAVEAGATLRATAEETHASGRTAEYEVVVVRVDGDGEHDADGGDRVATFRGRVYLPEG